MEPGVEARVREAVAALEAAGATVEDVSLPHTDYGLATYYIVAPAEASANLARYDGIRYGPAGVGDGDVLANYLATRGEGFGAEVKRRIMLGTYALSAGYYDAYYLKAQKVRTLIKRRLRRASGRQGFDALVAPTSPTVAFRFGARLADPVSMYLSDACTLPVEHGRPARHLDPVRPVRGPAGRAPAHRRGRGPRRRCFGLARGYEAITAGADWRALEPTELALADDPATADARRTGRGPGRRSLTGPSALGPGTRPGAPSAWRCADAQDDHHRRRTRAGGVCPAAAAVPSLSDLGRRSRRHGQAVAGRRPRRRADRGRSPGAS